jgi:hypothetical protein
MTINSDNENETNQLTSVIKAIVLALFAVVISVVSVSFAVHHMRLGFESDADVYENKIMSLATTAALVINGDDIVLDPAAAGQKYSAVINLLLPPNPEDKYSVVSFGLYQYKDGQLYVVHESSTENVYSASQVQVSNWLTAELKPYTVVSGKSISILVPITDSQQSVVGLFEINGQYSGLNNYGDVLEGKILLAVIVSVSIGLLLFSVQYALPKILSTRKKNWGDTE